MSRVIAVCAAMAIMLMPPLAQADDAPSLLDYVAAGTLPEADSPEEAAICAAETGYIASVFEEMEDTTQDLQDTLDDQANYWLERAAAINGKRPIEYMVTSEYMDTFLGLGQIDDDTNMEVALACADRIR